MNPALIVSDDKQRAPSRGFNAREFGRVIALTAPYRKKLILGLVITVCFAGLHTLGISAAFPVFKILLEQEGLHGWADRTIAGQRLDAEFAPITEQDHTRVVRLGENSPLHAQGVRPFDVVAHPDGLPVAALFEQIANQDGPSPITLLAGDVENLQTVSAALEPPNRRMTWLGWGASFMPPDGPDTKLRTLIWILAAVVTIVVAANVLRFTGEVLVSSAVLHAMMDLRDRLYDRILHLPMTFFSSIDTADLVTRFVQDIQEVQRGLTTLFGKAMREPIRGVFLIALALAINWRVTLTLIFVVPIAAAVFLAVGRKAKKANHRLLQAYGHMIGALTASLQNLRVVKAYNAEDQERARLDTVDRRMLKQQLRLAKLDAFLSPMLETLGVFAGSLLTVWLASLVIGGKLSTSEFATLGVVLSMIFDPLRKLSDVYVRIQRSTAGSERIFNVLDRPIETSLAPADFRDERAAVEFNPLERAIEFSGVSFTYPAGAIHALSDVTLTIHRGETLAIVGPNGSGKTPWPACCRDSSTPSRDRFFTTTWISAGRRWPACGGSSAG